MGFPCFIPRMCKFKNFSKERALHRCDVGQYDYEDIGIAYDEKLRQKQLNEKVRSILFYKEEENEESRKIQR